MDPSDVHLESLDDISTDESTFYRSLLKVLPLYKVEELKKSSEPTEKGGQLVSVLVDQNSNDGTGIQQNIHTLCSPKISISYRYSG